MLVVSHLIISLCCQMLISNRLFLPLFAKRIYFWSIVSIFVTVCSHVLRHITVSSFQIIVFGLTSSFYIIPHLANPLWQLEVFLMHDNFSSLNGLSGIICLQCSIMSLMCCTEIRMSGPYLSIHPSIKTHMNPFIPESSGACCWLRVSGVRPRRLGRPTWMALCLLG